MVSSASTDTAAPGPATAQQAGSGIDSLLRNPDHNEEINVIRDEVYGLVYKARDMISDKKVKLALTEDSGWTAEWFSTLCSSMWTRTSTSRSA